VLPHSRDGLPARSGVRGTSRPGVGGLGEITRSGIVSSRGSFAEPVGRSSSQKVSPVGGVIEGTGSARSGAAGMPIASTAMNSGRTDPGREPDAVLQWEVVEGVSPVIEPKGELPFVLGPGVFGVDR